jgi:hypothetical protein
MRPVFFQACGTYGMLHTTAACRVVNSALSAVQAMALSSLAACQCYVTGVNEH